MGFCWSVVKLIVIPLVLLTSFIKLSITWDNSYTCLVGKTAIVTGADTGLGFHIAIDFAKRGCRVILGCRSMCRGKCTRVKIIQATGNMNILVKPLDFGSLGSVREFARNISETEARLDILVNNPGAVSDENKPTVDGLNPLMQNNYFGPFLLTILLTGLLKRSAPSRVVNISSAAAHFANVTPDTLVANPLLDDDDKINYFANSKLCTIIFTNELARKLYSQGVSVNSMHPGITKSQIFNKTHGVKKLAIKALENTILKTSEEGAQTAIYVAVSRDLDGITGQYFDNCRVAWCPPMPTTARDTNLAKMLWEKSKEIVQLNSTEYQV